MSAGFDRFLEAGLLALPLFLTTRLLLLVAPTTGRTVGRWMLRIGLLLIVALGLFGYVFLERWPPEFSAVAVTGALVSVPLLLVWLGGLVVRLGRRLLRRERTEAVPARRRTEAVRIAVALVCLAAVVALSQWGQYRDEWRQEAQRQEALRTTVRALQVTARKRAEFDREVSLLEEKFTVLHQILPETLGVPDFMHDYRLLCEGQGFAVRSWRVRGAVDGSLSRAELALVLEGPQERLKALGERTEKLARLAEWRIAAVDQETVSAQVTIYALSLPEARRVADPCRVARSSDVWLWPMRGWLQSAFRVRAELCREAQPYEDVRRRVDDFQRSREEFTEMIDVIEGLRASRTLREVMPALPQPSDEMATPEPPQGPRQLGDKRT